MFSLIITDHEITFNVSIKPYTDHDNMSYFSFRLRTDNMFILVFVAPAAIILSLNTVFLFMTLCIIYRHTNGGYLPCRQDKDTTRSVR